MALRVADREDFRPLSKVACFVVQNIIFECECEDWLCGPIWLIGWRRGARVRVQPRDERKVLKTGGLSPPCVFVLSTLRKSYYDASQLSFIPIYSHMPRSI